MPFLAGYWFLLALWVLYCSWDNFRYVGPVDAVDKVRKKWPLVSILIPARNEEKRIGPCLESLMVQDYPRYEILVLDDRSTDGTFNLVQSYAKRNARLKILRGKELPSGWLGKPWACRQLSQKARGEWFFYTDADTWHGPDLLKRTVQAAEKEKADLLTLFTRQITKTWLELLVIPVMAFCLISFLPLRKVLEPGNRLNRFAGAGGQFIFIKRNVYRAFGGHETVKNEIVEDLNFGKNLVAKGYRLAMKDGSDFSFCRMYTNAREVWEGFSKNYFAAFYFSLPSALFSTGLLVLNGVVPLVALFLCPEDSLLGLAAGAALLAQLFARTLQAYRHKLSPLSVPLHPLGCLAFAVIGLNSIRWFLISKNAHWKGRRISGKT